MTEKRLKNLPVILLGIFVIYLAMGLRPAKTSSLMDISGFSRLPVLNGGRIKPLDTVARTALLLLRGKQTVRSSTQGLSADEWFMDMLFQPGQANTYPVFEIDDPDVLGVMGMQQTSNRYYSFTDLRPHLQEIENQSREVEKIKGDQRSRYQTAITNLQGRVILYQKLQNTLQIAGNTHTTQEVHAFIEKSGPLLLVHMAKGAKPSKELMAALQIAQHYDFMREVAEFYPVPGARGLSRTEWVSIGQGVLDSITTVGVPPPIAAYATLGDAYRAGDATAFNRMVIEYRSWLEGKVPKEVSRAREEFLFNAFEPFYKSMLFYVVVFLLAALSLLWIPRTLVRSAFMLLVLAFSVHTVGLISRMILQGRPPVTNLYSSAIFVGWAAVFLGLILEHLYKNGVGSMMASAIGFMTLIIAHHLASQGDTLEMMRAVLDSNFWLATHVVCITIGYSSTFLSGFLGVLYILRRAFDSHWTKAGAHELERMVYGIVCFATLFSFIGTILGGIWADQSWGRFWGWDPKENGALMIVLWNVFILHARVGKLIEPKTLMSLAVVGNIVTAFSWFGVNMLGIGLHSYGWMDKAFTWLLIFTATQLIVILLGFIPDEETRGSNVRTKRAV